MVNSKVDALRPGSLAEAIDFRTRTGALPFAGGTDLMVRRRRYTGTAGPDFSGPVLFLDGVPELKQVQIKGGILEAGAGVTLSDLLARKELPLLLRRGIELIAAPGLRNRATLAGNICNASPAADSLPSLYVHGAEVVLTGPSGERTLLLSDFIRGPGKTVLKDDELLTAVKIPLLDKGRIYYRKVGTRKANALSKLSAAGYVRTVDGLIEDFRFALGAVAPTVVRLNEVEQAVRGKELSELDADTLLELAAPAVCPIDDQRSTADYRRQVAFNCLKEFLEQIQNNNFPEET